MDETPVRDVYNEKLKEVLDNIQSIVYTSTENGVVTFVNKYTTEYLGVSEDYILGNSYIEFIHKDDVDRLSEMTRNPNLANHSSTCVFRLKRANDGMYRWFETHASRVMKDDNQQFWVSLATDVNDKVEAERKLNIEKRLV